MPEVFLFECCFSECVYKIWLFRFECDLKPKGVYISVLLFISCFRDITLKIYERNYFLIDSLKKNRFQLGVIIFIEIGVKTDK